ncbi:hypothetical protein [Pseudonocardia sp. WMMC193]|uniref:hypothetical protein n=1 Tax=Pseudonocardia sp. WMMC193 TaxID=2911965 RepID=UPI001F267EE6|nr:hypothetical protein [Pseudonocardia sp. WMMC193]MCF7548758.1 hypothetical protein [Pseudonocardia sp. WMMC193]
MHVPCLALLQVKAPSGIDPHVLEATLTRALNGDPTRPVVAELEWLPAWREGRGRRRRYAYVAVLQGAGEASELVRAAQRSAKRAVRKLYGEKCSARARTAEAGELPTLWCSVRGTPHRGLLASPAALSSIRRR